MISLIVPVFNEEASIMLFYTEVRDKLISLPHAIGIVFVDDGSSDASLEIIKGLAATDPLVSYISFSRNFGKEPALFAGLEHAGGDAVIPMDVDLQDPVEVIPQLIAEWEKGAYVVLAKRRERKTDSFFKRNSASFFYWLHNKIADSPIEANAGDFRLLDKKVVEALKTLPERNLFMKGVFSWVGFRTAIVEYDRVPRQAGKSKFNGWKLWNFALEGFTSFSTWPLRIWTYVGAFISLFAFSYAAWMIFKQILWGNPVPGYPSLMVTILFLGGIQLIGIGIIGEYLGRIYYESKNRPRYIVKESNTNKDETSL